jgi:preprotein translocase subunit SecA
VDGLTLQLHRPSGGCFSARTRRALRQAQSYGCDITYGTAIEFGSTTCATTDGHAQATLNQRDLTVNEHRRVDSILIDEERTPLFSAGVHGDVGEVTRQ